MLKNFEEKFNLYCNSKNFEINQNQILVIKKLQDYYKKNFKSFISKFFKKRIFKKRFLSLWRCWCWKNNDFRFFF